MPRENRGTPTFDSLKLELALEQQTVTERLARLCAAKVEATLYGHCTFIDHQVRSHNIVTSPDGSTFTVRAVSEQMRRTRPVWFGARVLQLRDFFNDSSDEAVFPDQPGAILLMGDGEERDGFITNPSVLARFHGGQAEFELDLVEEKQPEQLQYLLFILDHIGDDLKDIVGLPSTGCERFYFEKVVTHGGLGRETTAQRASALHRTITSGYSIGRLEKPFRRKS